MPGDGTKLSEPRPRFGVILDGVALRYCLNSHNVALFARVARRASSVLCCRATPLQKAAIVKLCRSRLGGRTLAMGDGANDVSMIQCADVGVGIASKEGMQAELAADFVLARMKHLKRLLLVQGHWAAARVRRTVRFFFMKGCLEIFAMLLYSVTKAGASATLALTQIDYLFYNMTHTAALPLSLGIFWQSASAKVLLALPELYKRKNELRKTEGWYWLTIFDTFTKAVILVFTLLTALGPTYSCQDIRVPVCWLLVTVVNIHYIIANEYVDPTTVLAIFLSYLSVGVSHALSDSPMIKVLWKDEKDWPIGVVHAMVQDGLMWCTLPLIICATMLPEMCARALWHTLQPSLKLRARLHQTHRKRKEKNAEKVVSKSWCH